MFQTDIQPKWVNFPRGQTGPHKDGWGITFMRGSGVAHLKILNPVFITCRSFCAGIPD
ncbi:hypothetical protein J4727_13870 [Providencia rettgeri]|uniref:Uncharacterized protein n=1 Tax=Providencia rettgeri TaxID=587 RepID=A0A939NGM2_PRORE|nr:hypothetical protein [Providencia rettgeri]